MAESVFKEKLGPLPTWVWIAGVTVVGLLYYLLVAKKKTATTSASTSTTVSASSVPQFVIQNQMPPSVVGPTTVRVTGTRWPGGTPGGPPHIPITPRTPVRSTPTPGVTVTPSTVASSPSGSIVATAPGYSPGTPGHMGGTVSYNSTGSVTVTRGSIPLTTRTTGMVGITASTTSLGQLTPKFTGTVAHPTAAAMKTPQAVALINSLKAQGQVK